MGSKRGRRKKDPYPTIGSVFQKLFGWIVKSKSDQVYCALSTVIVLAVIVLAWPKQCEGAYQTVCYVKKGLEMGSGYTEWLEVAEEVCEERWVCTNITTS